MLVFGEALCDACIALVLKLGLSDGDVGLMRMWLLHARDLAVQEISERE